MIENVTETSTGMLLGKVQKMIYDGYRFVTATCVDLGNGSFDIYYHFDKELTLKNYKITVTREEEIPSISKIYFCALLVENEMKELFGLNIANIAIDYGGHLLLSEDSPDAPMTKGGQITIEKREAKKDAK
ncbi:MAG: NADH-quinone oxidoreductase subunit C [Clostridiaceae bacterium]|nr:NADH-quinone oxidoreductase subunit C [Clostridiaceae bacterium]